MKFYLALLTLVGFASADNCGSAPLGSLGRRLDLDNFHQNPHNRPGSQGPSSTNNRQVPGGSRPSGSQQTTLPAPHTGQNTKQNQVHLTQIQSINFACFPVPRPNTQFIHVRPAAVVPSKTVTITVSPQVIPAYVAPVSRSYVQTAFFPTVDFYPWGNTGNTFTTTPHTTQPVQPPTTPTTTTGPVTPSPSLPLPQPIPAPIPATQLPTVGGQQSSIVLPEATVIVPTPITQTPTVAYPAPVISTAPTVITTEQTPVTTTVTTEQGYIPLDNTYLFNQDNSNQNLNLTPIETTEPAATTETIVSQTETQTLPADSTVVAQVLPAEGTVPAENPDFSQFDFTNFDFNNLDALLNAPAPAATTTTTETTQTTTTSIEAPVTPQTATN